jgi:hypothetical protein
MILALAWTYIPVVVVFLLWALAMRPVLRLIHLAPSVANGPAQRPPAPAAPWRRPARR